MATTTNYGWDTPDDTDLVKDGALAIRDLGQDVDTSLYSITNGKNVGLVPLVNTTFTSTAAVQVDNVFTTDYDNYRIIFRLTAASASAAIIRATLVDGTTPTTTAKAFYGSYGSTNSGTAVNGFGSALTYFGFMEAGNASPTLTNATIEVIAPKIATSTGFTFNSFNLTGGVSYSLAGGGAFEDNTLFEGIRFAPASGTFSGVIKIYGYKD
jgi:hypothetical protein